MQWYLAVSVWRCGIQGDTNIEVCGKVEKTDSKATEHLRVKEEIWRLQMHKLAVAALMVGGAKGTYS